MDCPPSHFLLKVALLNVSLADQNLFDNAFGADYATDSIFTAKYNHRLIFYTDPQGVH
jgi:hypothetical protein